METHYYFFLLELTAAPQLILSVAYPDIVLLLLVDAITLRELPPFDEYPPRLTLLPEALPAPDPCLNILLNCNCGTLRALLVSFLPAEVIT